MARCCFKLAAPDQKMALVHVDFFRTKSMLQDNTNPRNISLNRIVQVKKRGMESNSQNTKEKRITRR